MIDKVQITNTLCYQLIPFYVFHPYWRLIDSVPYHSANIVRFGGLLNLYLA